MAKFWYVFLGSLIGLVAGVLFGFVFDSFYTKKSEVETKQRLQAVVFGGIGLFIGGGLGLKISDEEEEKKQKAILYANSLQQSTCAICDCDYTFSNLDEKNTQACSDCYELIKVDYSKGLKDLSMLLKGIDDLKKSSSVNLRLEKMKNIVLKMKKYEDLDFDFIAEKPSALLEKIESHLIK